MKLLKRFFIIVMILLILLVSVIVLNGYKMYSVAINEIPLQDKIAEIQSDENYVSLDSLPDIYKNAVIAVEDHRYEKHPGIDIIALGRAVLTNIKNFALVEGGSTITQQLSKNLYFTQKKEFTRKIAEVFMAFNLEKNYSKDDILELYINTIYFGNGYYGINEACKGYFSKEPKDMTPYEATMLAGIPNAPSVYSLDSNPDLASQRQKRVLQAMVENGYISQEEADMIYNSK